MSPVARILFFIVLSAALHFAVLSFDFTAPGLPSPAHLLDVGYVSRPLNSFYPVTALSPVTHHVLKVPLPPSNDRAPASILSIPHQQRKTDHFGDVTVSSSSAAVTPDFPPPLKSTVAGRRLPVATLLSGKITDYTDNETTDVQWPTAEDHDFDKGDPKSTVISGPLSPPAAESGLSLAASPGEMMVQTESSDNNRQQILPPVGEGEGATVKVSTNALPRYDLNPPPRYPDVAKLRNWEGKVVFKALILKSGRVGHLNLLASSGYKSLDNAARKAIHRWQFKPAISSGIAIDSQVEIPITFSLKDL